MDKLTKRMRIISKKVDFTKKYNIKEALTILKDFAKVKFVESVDVAVNLGIDARKSDQNVCGATVLPYGTGRKVRVAVFTQGDNVELAKTAGADIVDIDDLLYKIKKGDFNFDVVIATPDTMDVVGKLGKFLGPRGMMPNNKFGTVTINIVEAIKNAKKGQVRYCTDKNGIIHTTIGKVDFESYKLEKNFQCLIIAIKKLRPAQVKGIYIKQISISTTMGVGLKIDKNCI